MFQLFMTDNNCIFFCLKMPHWKNSVTNDTFKVKANHRNVSLMCLQCVSNHRNVSLNEMFPHVNKSWQGRQNIILSSKRKTKERQKIILRGLQWLTQTCRLFQTSFVLSVFGHSFLNNAYFTRCTMLWSELLYSWVFLVRFLIYELLSILYFTVVNSDLDLGLT